jgi:hypothetical protein
VTEKEKAVAPPTTPSKKQFSHTCYSKSVHLSMALAPLKKKLNQMQIADILAQLIFRLQGLEHIEEDLPVGWAWFEELLRRFIDLKYNHNSSKQINERV